MNENTIKLFQSKKTDHWQTPDPLFSELNLEFGFNFDPCPLMSKINYLNTAWGKRCFVNPPYSKVKEFLIKAHKEIAKGNTDIAVFLIFANTDTAFFHDLIKDKVEIRFLRGRIKFLDLYKKEVDRAMRPSMIAIFRR